MFSIDSSQSGEIFLELAEHILAVAVIRVAFQWFTDWTVATLQVANLPRKKKQYKLNIHHTTKHNVASQAGRLPVSCTQEEMKETGSHPFRNWEVYEREQRFLDNTLQNACGEIRVSIIVQLSQFF